MTDNNNLQQFLDQMSSYSEDSASGSSNAAATSPIPAIGHVVEIAGSGAAWSMHADRMHHLMNHPDPSIAMSGQVGSQIKMKVGASWLIANVRTLCVRRRRRRSSPTSTSSAKAARPPTGSLSSFRRGVTRYPIPGCEIMPVIDRRHARDLRRRRQPPRRDRHRLSDRRHSRHALRRSDAVEAFRDPRDRPAPASRPRSR